MGRIKDNISRNITMHRKSCKLSQKELAEQLNTKPSTVSSWEQGASTPNAEMLFEICRIFKISMDEMYGIDEDQTERQFLRVVQYLEDAGFSIEQDEKDQEYDNFQICNESGTVDIMQKQNLIDLVESVIKEGEEYKEHFIIDKLKRLLSRPNK